MDNYPTDTTDDHIDPTKLKYPQRYYWEGTPDMTCDDEDIELLRRQRRHTVGERIADGFAMLAMGGDG